MPSGSFGILTAVLVGIEGGRVGNTEGVEDNQSGSESKTEREGSVCKLEGKTGACGGNLVDWENLESSSNVTHCLFGFPTGSD